MHFDTTNKVIKLCADGMEAEGHGQMETAMTLFQEAWDKAETDFERFTCAHYLARHQKTVADKLKWDETALQMALNTNNETLQPYYPSLYLNIGKCYEDLKDNENAGKNYRVALSFSAALPDDGYGKVIKSGIAAGLERTHSSPG